ncbi:Tc toxin subunit A [Pseudomonas entomophila]|uniref:Tc toxin subunit A-related protein n=1 Tax=Pseudomonas entomophila TaxID=312306 RepID=UPI002406A39A|nr:neuraminidase-like domain-containing protein [Pseudomonas entomophila]MDF9619410.1 Tc toxin subunit A [Pseudomonas entomophila]
MATQHTDNSANTYAKLFPEQLANLANPDAPESNSGPIAYLHDLYKEVLAQEGNSRSTDRLTLAQRRPDIAQLFLDPDSLEQPISALTLAVRSLARQAQSHAGATAYLPEVLASAGKHADLPFHAAQEQIKATLKQRKLSYFDLLQQAQYSYPNFCNQHLRDDDLREVMLKACGLSPALKSLLLDHSAITEASYKWQSLYGVPDTIEAPLTHLQDIDTYCRQSGLTTPEVLQLLAVSGIDDNAQTGFTSVRCSQHYSAGKPADGLQYGAIYLNAGRTTALTVKDARTEAGITLQFDQPTQSSLVRMYQMVRLQRALELPFAEVDWLLVSILRAQGQTGDWRITDETLQALGVYLYLNEAHAVSAEQFAALIYQVCPYSTNENPPLLDRVLDGPRGEHAAELQAPLQVNDEPFDPADNDAGQHQILAGLNVALGCDEHTTLAYLEQARQALKLQQPNTSLPVISSLYRLSRLHRLLQRDFAQYISMLALLDPAGQRLLPQLAGTPAVSSDVDTDMLDVLVALSNLDRWLRQEQVAPLDLLGALTEVKDAKLSSDSSLVRAINQLLPKNDATAGPTAPAAPIATKNTASDEATTDTFIAQLLMMAFAGSGKDVIFSQAHVGTLLRWCNTTAGELWADIERATDEQGCLLQPQQLDGSLWLTLKRHAQVINLLRLSPMTITTLCDMPERFDLQGDVSLDAEAGSTDQSGAQQAPAKPPTLDLDLCYQLSRYRRLIEVSRANRLSEADTARYLTNHSHSEDSAAVESAVEALSALTGWSKTETAEAVPYNRTLVDFQNPIPRFDTYLAGLTAEEAALIRKEGQKRFVTDFVLRYKAPEKYNDTLLQSAVEKFDKFLKDNPGPLRVTSKQYGNLGNPAYWTRMAEEWKAYNIAKGNTFYKHRLFSPISFEQLPEGWDKEARWHPCVPSTVTDLDYVLRLQALCYQTGLSCSTLTALEGLEDDSPYLAVEAVSHALMTGLDADCRENVEKRQHEGWRNALAAYLIAYWAPANTSTQSIATFDQLSDYCLTDIKVSSEVVTTPLKHAIGSLQHYLFRLFAHLEPGYPGLAASDGEITAWQRDLTQYKTWKRRVEQRNHPANLIHYANRPNKSAAYKDLEVELSQGKLDNDRLDVAIANYLTKFERISNLHVISGYLDGHDPKKDVYHLIARTNSTPVEYYWRTLDISQCDSEGQLRPSAWSEWEKITLAPGGEIVRYEREITSPKKQDVATEDSKAATPAKAWTELVRPVVIEGRRYVFWVERSTTDLPDGENPGKSKVGKRKFSVNYSFQQSDESWSTANEIMCLDGWIDGAWKTDQARDVNFKPGLIVIVNKEGPREEDPWLVALLYDTAATDASTTLVRNKNYYIEARDLLLIDTQPLEDQASTELASLLLKTYATENLVQHTYDGEKQELSLTYSAIFYKPKLKAVQDKLKATVYFTTDFLEEYKTQYNIPKKTSLSDDFNIIEKDFFKLFNAIKSNETNESYESDERDDDKKFSSALPSIDIKVSLENNTATVTPTLNLKLPKYAKAYVTYHTDLPAISPGCVPLESGTVIRLDNFNSKRLYITVLIIIVYIDCNKATGACFAYDFRYIHIHHKKDELWQLAIQRSPRQAQYLDLTAAKDIEPLLLAEKFRLNTLFGKQLVARATHGVHKVLEWKTQNLLEPTLDNTEEDVEMDFQGANALYFRELFLHVPAMIASRLTEQQKFEDAESWYLRYLFNPYRIHDDEQGRPAPWCTRPLSEAHNSSSVLEKDVVPIEQVFFHSQFYQEAVFLSLLENWQLKGDHFYRQGTVGSLNQAWVCYQQAYGLLGSLPETTTASRWVPVALDALDESTLRKPINPRVQQLRDTLTSRLFNLRHGLDLDGRRLPPMDFKDDSEQSFIPGEGGKGDQPNTSHAGLGAVPAYRFRQLLPIARAAAQQLLDFGRHYLRLMEREDDLEDELELKAHEIKMAEFAVRLQKEAINSLAASNNGLIISRNAATARRTYLSDLIEVGRSPEELAATALTWAANGATLLSIPFEFAAGMTDAAVPTIYGFAFGGNRPGSIGNKIALGLRIGGEAARMAADELLLQDQYNRRAAEWNFERQQVDWDLKLIDQEIVVSDIERKAANLALAQAQAELAQLKAVYEDMISGFIAPASYNWMVERQQQIHASAYHAVRSLCLEVETAWRYEIGDYRRDSFINTNAWQEDYKGMLVGESLLVDLQEMENEYLAKNKRRLTIKRSFSLKKKLGGQVKWDKVFEANAERTAPLIHSFEFTAEDFDKSYPGQYLRQLKHLSVSLVLKAGKNVEELCALLKQTASTTLLKPNEAAARSFYPGKDDDSTVIAARNDTKLLLRNPRENQQIALSSTVAEDGLGYDAGTWVYELMFHDGRYLPFEGTGAISKWTLELLGDEGLLKDLSVIDDIKFNMVYTAEAGDDTFTKAIGDIRKPSAQQSKA